METCPETAWNTDRARGELLSHVPFALYSSQGSQEPKGKVGIMMPISHGRTSGRLGEVRVRRSCLPVPFLEVE